MFLARKLAGRRSQLFGLCGVVLQCLLPRQRTSPHRLIAKRGAVPARSRALAMPIHRRVGESACRRPLLLRRCLIKQNAQKT
jgi:hypothetical protein